ncbi:hypothetical protein TEA_003420 [Camellia sinensis var. sinensis]|uniref:Protein kinase domain-containing protein n=1 Tax=Camellia sinensis var. sinensis TaxID=542762 RepID=A0A4S4DXD9_CAMSN|nr:hypothetical protein TEA_003420 [Camellia sinensis var. sinensis]
MPRCDSRGIFGCSKPLPSEWEIEAKVCSMEMEFWWKFLKEVLEYENYSIDSCNSWVNAPVESGDIKTFLEMNFTDVLRRGFVLQWSEDYCSDCKRSGGNWHMKWRIALVIGLGAGGVIVVVAIVCIIYHRRNKKYNATSSWISRYTSHTSSMNDIEKEASYYGVQTFSYNELQKATNNFDSKKEVGDGGFGTVYQGKLRDGRVVVVKRLYEHNFKRVEQFMNEIEILTRLRHPNLVSLYGFTSRHCRELLLVYEYIPNGTVADHLHGDCTKPCSLSWTTRMSIAFETASALAYLHASDVIHRDVKTNNILLDNSFCVKVADFGLSRLFPTDATHVSTAPQGTVEFTPCEGGDSLPWEHTQRSRKEATNHVKEGGCQSQAWRLPKGSPTYSLTYKWRLRGESKM